MELIPEPSPDEADVIWGLAIRQARQSSMKFKVGAVVVNSKNKILGSGYNNHKTHPRFGSKDGIFTLHAEGAALWDVEKSGNDARGSTIIVYRRNALNAKPCKDCQRIIRKAGVKRVIYTHHE